MKSIIPMKRLLVLKTLAGLLTLVLLVGCSSGSEASSELTDEEIQAILADVTGGEEALKTAGLAYFSELSSESKNLIAPADLNELIQEGADIFILDLRSADDYGEGHIQGAVNIGWFEVGNNIEQLPADKRIVVTCYSGQSAGQTIGVLRTMGYDAIALLGGMNNGWYANDMPVVK